MSARQKGLTSTRWGGLRRTVAGIALTALAVGGLSAIALTAPKAADAVPGNPGTPSAGTTVYAEDFQNVPNATTVQTLTQYTGATGQKYTANDAWLTFCNGLIASQSQSPTNASAVSACVSQVNWNTAQQLSYALGVNAGQTPAQAQGNYADTAYTANNPGVGLVEFQTASNIPFTASNRFITFSVDAAAVNCATAAHPLLQFQLLNSGGTASNVGSQIDACSSTKTVAVPAFGVQNALTANVGTYTSNGAQLFSGSSIGVRMINNQGTGAGNDHAIDNIKILDVTPQLDKSFSPATVPTGGVSTLTFTVTNTSELAAKNGWSFTDKLPAGLTIANPNAAATTCGAGQVTAAAGSDSVAVTGNLNAGQASCTVSVNVTSPTAGSFTNGPDNVTETGLNPPGNTTVTFVDPNIPTVLCTTDPVIFNTGYNQATDGQVANGATDARWTVAGGVDGLNHSGTAISGPGTIALPPAGTTYGPAQAGKVNNLWSDSQSGKSQWISANYVAPTNGQNQTTGGGDWYYRYQFNLDPQVDPATFQLDMKWLADNAVAGVWVNNQPQTGTNLPQNTTDPYQYAGFQTANAASTQMAGDFKTGLNTILVQVQSNYPAEGFDAEVTSTALCPDPTLTPTKSARNLTSGDNSVLNVGDKIQYTVTAKNDAKVPFTADNPATITDDLTDVIDDATLDQSSIKATVGGDAVDAPTFDSPNLTWSGPLAPGATVRITYTVTYTGGGNSELVNNACVPEGTQTSGSNCTPDVTLPAPDIHPWKTVEKSDGPLGAGSTLTYTLHFENTGATTGPVNEVDNLSQVLDDATVTTEPATATGPLTATRNGDTIAVTGNLPAGATSTITYTVTLKADGQRGDNIAANYLLQPGEEPPSKPVCVPTDEQRPDCTINKVAELVPSKTVDPKSGSTVTAGQVLTYTLTFDNSKGADAATVTGYSDDLSKVLDDATVTTQPTASIDSLEVGAIANGSFPVTGTVPAGKIGTVTYKVTVKADGQRGDNNLGNSLAKPGLPPITTENPVSDIVPSKTVDPESGSTVEAGQVLTYTLTFTNKGKGAGPVDYLDDMTNVVDDATVTKNPTASDDALKVTSVKAGYAITGELAGGQTVTVTYQVTVNADGKRGNNDLGNKLTNSDPNVPNEPPIITENPVPDVTHAKTVDPTSTTPVVPGQVLTYTLTYKNDGKAAGQVDEVDDITQAIDDATVTKQPTVQGGHLEATAFGSDNRSHITGTLPAGATVTVTYQLTVKAANQLGDKRVANFLLDPSTPPPSSPDCKPTSSQNPDCTVNEVGSLKVSKIVDPKTGTTVHPGDTLRFTLSFENVGVGAAKVDYVDDMTGVLDDATVTTQPVATDDALTVTKVTDGKVGITGSLAGGQKVLVTYAVTTKPFAQQGDHVMENYLDPVNVSPADRCVSTDPLCTRNPIAAPPVTPVTPAGLAFTGTELVGPGIGIAILLLALGGGLLIVRRRRQDGDVQDNA